MPGIVILCDREGGGKRRKCRSLKVWPEFFVELETGRKTFEIRSFPYGEECEVGEILLLDEYDPQADEATGQSLVYEVTYALKIADSDDSLSLPFPKTDNPVWCLGIRRV